LPQRHPHGIVADLEDHFEFMEGGVRVLADVGGELDGIKLAPATPAGLGGEGVGLGGGEIAVAAAFAQREAAGGPRPRAAALDKLHHPLAQIHRIGFHALSLPLMLPMSM